MTIIKKSKLSTTETILKIGFKLEAIWRIESSEICLEVVLDCHKSLPKSWYEEKVTSKEELPCKFSQAFFDAQTQRKQLNAATQSDASTVHEATPSLSILSNKSQIMWK